MILDLEEIHLYHICTTKSLSIHSLNANISFTCSTAAKMASEGLVFVKWAGYGSSKCMRFISVKC